MKQAKNQASLILEMMLGKPKTSKIAQSKKITRGITHGMTIDSGLLGLESRDA